MVREGMRTIYRHAVSWCEGRSPRVVLHFAGVAASGEYGGERLYLARSRKFPNIRTLLYLALAPFYSQRFLTAIVPANSFGAGLDAFSRTQSFRGMRPDRLCLEGRSSSKTASTPMRHLVLTEC